LAEFPLEVLDLVAQPGGQLEVELFGSMVHLTGEFMDELSQLGRGQTRSLDRGGTRHAGIDRNRSATGRHTGALAA
jgi:hypothetical protein